LAHQNADHGWGGGFLPAPLPDGELPQLDRECERGTVCSSVEETALAVEALIGCRENAAWEASLALGVEWLVDKIQRGEHRKCSPIGFYFAKLWYYENMYPLMFTVGALGRALQISAGSSPAHQPGIPLAT